MGTQEMVEIADLISSVINNSTAPDEIAANAKRVKDLCDRFPIYR
jgi:glycine/serine hydroxymethyltransferase